MGVSRLGEAGVDIVSRTFLVPLAEALSTSFFLGVGAVNNDEHQEHEKHNLHVCREAEEQWKESLNLSAEYTCWSEGTAIGISNTVIIILTSVALYGRELN